MGDGTARRFRCVTSANFVSSHRDGGVWFPVSNQMANCNLPCCYYPSAMLPTTCEIFRNKVSRRANQCICRTKLVFGYEIDEIKLILQELQQL